MSDSRPDSWTPPRSAPRRSSPASFGVRPSQLTGAVLGGRYKIHGYLRRGLSARVYLAEDLESQGSVVIKLLSPTVTKDDALRQQIAEARERTQPIQHPNLVDLLGVAETAAGIPYLVMEALAGETLDESLRRLGTLPLDLALVVARQITAGVSALHAAGVVHADVRPENVMLLGAPEQPYGAKLLNYGIARYFRDASIPSSFDPTRSAYFAPEQLLDGRSEPTSDVYALGVLLLQILSGRLPFQESSEPECLKRKLTGDTLQGIWVDEAVDARLEWIVLNATRRHPKNRYDSSEALLNDLDAIVGLSTRAVRILPSVLTPDSYEPSSEAGRARLVSLAEGSATANS
ncbi:MAG: serine/threonine-protein kinase [Myxococcota bacterium]